MPFKLVREYIDLDEVDGLVVVNHDYHADKIIGFERDIIQMYPEAFEDSVETLEYVNKEIIYEGVSKQLLRTKYPVTTGDYFRVGSMYQRLLYLFDKLGCESVAIPFFPYTIFADHRKDVFHEVKEEIISFLETHEMMIYLIVGERHQIEIDKSVKAKLDKRIASFEMFEPMMQRAVMHSVDFDEVFDNKLDHVDEGFSMTLMNLIDQSGEKDVTIYKRANVDRRLFSKIRSNLQYQPSKKTALAFAIALKLSIRETQDFIARAGYTLSKQLAFDIVVSECLIRGIYDIHEINEILFEYDLDLF
jgi:hypothetical protein